MKDWQLEREKHLKKYKILFSTIVVKTKNKKLALTVIALCVSLLGCSIEKHKPFKFLPNKPTVYRYQIPLDTYGDQEFGGIFKEEKLETMTASGSMEEHYLYFDKGFVQSTVISDGQKITHIYYEDTNGLYELMNKDSTNMFPYSKKNVIDKYKNNKKELIINLNIKKGEEWKTDSRKFKLELKNGSMKLNKRKINNLYVITDKSDESAITHYYYQEGKGLINTRLLFIDMPLIEGNNKAKVKNEDNTTTDEKVTYHHTTSYMPKEDKQFVMEIYSPDIKEDRFYSVVNVRHINDNYSNFIDGDTSGDSDESFTVKNVFAFEETEKGLFKYQLGEIENTSQYDRVFNKEIKIARSKATSKEQVIKFPIKKNLEWQITEGNNFSIKYKILDNNATTKIPMGTFSKVIKVRNDYIYAGQTDQEDSDYIIDYYAKGIGLIKTEFYNSDGTLNQVHQLYNDKGIVPKQDEE